MFLEDITARLRHVARQNVAITLVLSQVAFVAVVRSK